MIKYLRAVELRMTLCGGFAAFVTCLLWSIEQMACISCGVPKYVPTSSCLHDARYASSSSGGVVLVMVKLSRMSPDGNNG